MRIFEPKCVSGCSLYSCAYTKGSRGLYTAYSGISPVIWNGLLSVLHVYFQEQSSRWEVTLLTFHSELVKQPCGFIFSCVMRGRD